jgi:hypothetical protein
MHIFFLILTLLSSNVIASNGYVNYSARGIVDDEIANAIRPPRPPSATDLINDINKNYPQKDKQIKYLDLSNNNMTVKGATLIMNFCYHELLNLEEINLSYNRIYEEPQNSIAFQRFEEEVLNLLREDIIIDLTGNAIASPPWIESISFKLGRSPKIRWIPPEWRRSPTHPTQMNTFPRW